MQVDWELSQSLASDGQGVRCACILPPSSGDGPDSFRVVTGNQGGGLCEFGVPSGNITLIPFQHDHAVSALLGAPLSEGSNRNLYVSGCKDTIIRIFDGVSHEVVGTLPGHERPVTSLAWCPKPEGASSTAGGQLPFYLVSGSWDGTAKVWDVDRKCLIATLPGHENSVCVYGIATAPSGSNTTNVVQVATASAGSAQNNQVSGFTVRLWHIDVVTGQVKTLESVVNDHGGPIRDICGVTVNGTACLATCSNDGTAKLRDEATAQSTTTLTLLMPQAEQQQHPPMLLSLAALQNDQTCLIGSAEDGTVAIWSLEEQVPPQNVVHSECVWRVVALPNGDFASCCQDGTLRIFTRASDRMAPQAERQAFTAAVAEAQQKQSSGPSDEEVAKLPKWEEQRQQMIGRSEGQVQLFQKNGNAIAAQWSMASRTWIEVGQVMGSKDSGTIDGEVYDHVLPIEVDLAGGEVANLQLGYNTGENTFVAAQRFIDANMLPQHHLSQVADYIEQRVGNSNPTLGGGAAPTSTGGGAGTPIASYEFLPMKAYKAFEISEKSAAATFDKMKTKIQESGKLSEEQLGHVSSLMQTLAASNRYHASKVEDAELNVLYDMLDQLPPAEVFPFLDLARLAALHPDAASKARFSYWDRMVQKVLALSENTSDLEGPAAVAIPMLSLRLFANAFRGGPGSLQAVSSAIAPIVSRAEAHSRSKNKNVRLSVATVLYNVCCYLHSNPSAASESIVLPIVTTINSIVDARIYESEALFRSMVALGTIVMASKEAKEAAKVAGLSTKVEPAASPHSDQLKQLAKEIYSVLG